MEIRKLIYSDLPQLALLYKNFWNEDSDIQKMEKIFERLKNNDAYIFLCAIENNKICGSIMGIICYGLYGAACSTDTAQSGSYPQRLSS